MNEFLAVSGGIIIASCLLTPLLVFGTYHFSGASLAKSAGISAGVAVWGVVMYLVCTSWQFSPRVPGGSLGVSIFLAIHLMLPTMLVARNKQFFVGDGLNMRWLLVPHLFRFVGILFLLEAFNGQLGTVFSLVSGVGDIVAAAIAATLLLVLLTGGRIGSRPYMFLIVFGATDFVIAFTLGAISAETYIQLIAIDEVHRVTHFPIGMIPFFLVPMVMAFHWLMFFSLRKQTNMAHDEA